MLALLGQWGGGDVWRVTSGEFPSNSYVCSTGFGRCILIDGGLDPSFIDKQIDFLGLTPTAMFCTHGHFDHAGSAAFFQRKYDIPVYLHRDDLSVLKSSNFLLMAFNLTSRVDQPSKVTAVNSGESISVGEFSLTFHGAPGHTPGSCLLALGNALFTGDTIYARGVGLSNLPGEQPSMLKKSILKLWPILTTECMIYPGHGSCASGAEVRLTNYALLEFLGMHYST